MTVTVKESMVRILRPDFVPKDRHGNTIVPKLSDYIEVPRMTQRGEFRIVDLLPMETLAGLSMFRDRLAGVTRRGKR